MTEEVTKAQHRQSRRIAAIAVIAVAVFSLVFIGLVSLLNNVAQDSQSDEAPIANVAPSDPFYTLIIGSDSRKGTALYTGKSSDHAQIDQHSDIMTLVRVDPQTYTITLVTIPRDTVWPGRETKINDALLGGDSNEVVNVAEELTGVSIDYYMMTTFTAFETLVDALGGVNVDVPRDITVPDPSTAQKVSVKAGEDQTLDGSQTLVLARARKEYVDNQDALRQVNVRNIETALIEKVLSFDSESRANAALVDLEETTTTNMDMALVGYLVVEFITHHDEVTFYSCTGPYAGGENAAGLWVVEEDPGAWAELMDTVDAGEDPEGIVKLPTHS